MTRIVISEFMDQDAVDDLSQTFDVHYDPDLVDDSPGLIRLAAECDALIVRNRTQVRDQLLDSATRLTAVGRLGVGLDNIDLEACKRRNIQVCPATGANNLCVAEYVIAGLFMLIRGAYQSSASVAQGRWPRNELIGGEVSGKRLGLIGFGGIARDVAVRAKALGMQVCASDPYVSADDPVWRELGVSCQNFEDVLRDADAISLHVPLTDETRRQIDASAIARMKPGAIIINAARGGVVDESALANSLRSEQLGGAMLDVFEDEPLAAGSSLVDIPNLILTPHIAGVTRESNVRVSSLTARNIRAALGAGP